MYHEKKLFRQQNVKFDLVMGILKNLSLQLILHARKSYTDLLRERNEYVILFLYHLEIYDCGYEKEN